MKANTEEGELSMGHCDVTLCGLYHVTGTKSKDSICS